MSRSNPFTSKVTPTDEPYKEIPEEQRHYIGREPVNVQYSRDKPLHWYEAEKLGYKPKAWPKRNDDCDDDRYNLIEKEIR